MVICTSDINHSLIIRQSHQRVSASQRFISLHNLFLMDLTGIGTEDGSGGGGCRPTGNSYLNKALGCQKEERLNAALQIHTKSNPNHLCPRASLYAIALAFGVLLISFHPDAIRCSELMRQSTQNIRDLQLKSQANHSGSVGGSFNQDSLTSDHAQNSLKNQRGASGNLSQTSEHPEAENQSTKRKFTFTVNGKEFGLELPKSNLSSAQQVSEGKVNRMGEFTGLVDYEAGFDVASEVEPSNGISMAPRQLRSSKQYPDETVSSSESKVSGELRAYKSSSSSALMSPGGLGLDDNADNGASQLQFNSPSMSPGNIDSSRLVNSRNQARIDSTDGATGNKKIISDWPKASSISTQQTDRDSSKATQILRRGQSKSATSGSNNGSKFSTLLSGGFNGSNNNNNNHNHNNEGANQSAEHHTAWDAKQSRKSPAQSVAKFSTKVGNTEILTGPLTSNDNDPVNLVAGKTSVKRNAHPKAPVYAKPRYTSSIAASNVFYSAPGESGKLESSSQLKTSSDTNKGEADETTGTDESSDDDQSAQPDTYVTPVSSRGNGKSTQPSPLALGKVIKPQTDNSSSLKIFDAPSSNTKTADQLSESQLGIVSEYKTNFTHYAPTPKHSSSTRRQKLSSGEIQEIRAHVIQRDLTHKLQPLSQASFHPSRPFRQDLQSARLSFSQRVPDPVLGANGTKADLSSSVGATGSIVRTGSIITSPSGLDLHQYGGFSPAAMASLSQAQDEHLMRSQSSLRGLMSAQHLPLHASQEMLANARLHGGLHPSRGDHMMATANQLGVTHMGPQSSGPINDGPSLGYGSDYHDSRQLSNSGVEPSSNSMDSGLVQNSQGSGPSRSLQEDQRGPSADHYGGEPGMSGYESSNGIRAKDPADATGSTSDQVGGSRSAVSDMFMRTNPKAREASSLGHPMRSSLDPFEEMAGSGVLSSDYERELADLDEEFSRHTSYRRPESPGSLMSDSFLTVSPEKYETRHRYNRRLYPESFPGDYLSASGSISSMVPRTYSRGSLPWSSSSQYADSAADPWSDSAVEFSPLASFMSPHYNYRYRPSRYHRIPHYSGSSGYLSASASEHHLQPAYNIIPSYASAMPTETISFAISPLAAAAAAAASAIVAADKSRHQGHGWLTLPRFTTSTSSLGSAPAATNQPASSAPAQTSALPATAAIQTAYIQRAPNPFALNTMPIYAIAPRPGSAPLASAASAANPAIIPYYHGGSPAIIAYRPAGLMPPASLLTAASFAYPLRLPTATTIGRPAPITIGSSARSIGLRPIYADLQLSESKSKSNLTNSNENKSGQAKSVSLTAMARNLTRKMFGSASQMRPLHVAPPNNFDLFSSTQNSSNSSSSSV